MAADSTSLSVRGDGVTLSGEAAGSGPPIVLLHGLTATRRYVVMGSRTLERSGHRVLSYDARGHGRSTPAPDRGDYGYEHLAADLEAVLDALGIARAVLAGASMGAHTALRLALRRPERVAALGLITPSFDPARPRTPAEFDGLGRTGAGAATGRSRGVPRGLRPGCGARGLARDGGEGSAPAPVGTRAPAGGRRRPRSRAQIASLRGLGRARRDSHTRRSWWPVATRRIRAIRWPWANATRRRSRARGWWWRRRGRLRARRSPGRAASSRGCWPSWRARRA